MDDSKMIPITEDKIGGQHDIVYPSNSGSVEEFLAQMNSYIVRAVTKEMRGNSFRAHPALLSLEIDEVVQRIRVKFWQAWQKRHIEKPDAYLKCIIHSEIAEFARTYEPFIPLPFDEHGELCQGQMILAFDKGLQDPLEIQLAWMPDSVFSQNSVYYHSEAWERITKKNILTIVKVILYLPEQQRYALLYKLSSVIDDIFYLKTALQELGVDLQQIMWPQTPQEKQRVRASYFTARRTLVSILGHKREDRMKNAIEWVTWQERRRSWAPIDLTAKEKSEPTREITHMLCHLEDLKESYQTVLRLHYLEQRSYSDIATSLDAIPKVV